ncbi:TPA: transporter, partial [Klebsiella pneumoniae]
MSLLRSLLFFFGAAVAAALAVLCLWVDIRVFGNDIPEVSLTEVVQESVLAVIVLVHLLLARKYAHLRYSNILIGGFFLAMLIRELDGLFDLLSHGSWVWFALLATAGSLLLPLRHLHQTLSQLAAYTRTPYYGMMISGLLAILV